MMGWVTGHHIAPNGIKTTKIPLQLYDYSALKYRTSSCGIRGTDAFSVDKSYGSLSLELLNLLSYFVFRRQTYPCDFFLTNIGYRNKS